MPSSCQSLAPRLPAATPPPCLHLATQSVIIFTVLLGAFTSGLVGWLLKPTDMTPGNAMPTLPSMDPDTLK